MSTTQIPQCYKGAGSRDSDPNSDLSFVSKTLTSAISHSFLLELSSIFFNLVTCLCHTKPPLPL